MIVTLLLLAVGQLTPSGLPVEAGASLSGSPPCVRQLDGTKTVPYHLLHSANMAVGIPIKRQ